MWSLIALNDTSDYNHSVMLVAMIQAHGIIIKHGNNREAVTYNLICQSNYGNLTADKDYCTVLLGLVVLENFSLHELAVGMF